MAADKEYRYAMSVLVADRVGVLRDITAAVADMGGNIDGISQTVVEGYFTVALTATFPIANAEDQIVKAVQRNFREGEVSVMVRAYERRSPGKPTVAGARYVVTITGLDRPGILKTVTSFLAQKGINVEDWYVLFEKPRVTHIGELTVPDLLDIKQIQEEFQQVLAKLHLKVSIQHENIFRATNEVGAIQPWLARPAPPA